MLQQPHSKCYIPILPTMRGTIFGYKISIFTKFFQIYCNYNILWQTIFQTAPHFLTLGVAVPNTINAHEFRLEHHTWLEIQNSIKIFRGYLWLFKNSCQIKTFFRRCLACITLQIVSLKLTN